MNDLMWMISHELYSVLYAPDTHTVQGTKLETINKGPIAFPEPMALRIDLPALVRPTPMRREH